MKADAPTLTAGTLAAMRPMMLRLASLQLRQDSWAEDVVSETMLAVIESAGRFEGRSDFRTWVVGILKHKIVDQLRRHRREVSLGAAGESTESDGLDDFYGPDGHLLNRPSDWGDPEAALAERQFFSVLQGCVEHLPPALGRIFLMREWLQFEAQEICKELDISATNCFVMLHRARMRLRECLEIRWFASRSA